MDIVDITPAIDQGDLNFIRKTFRALVGYPREEPIRCDSPSQLFEALGPVCNALAGDIAPMPDTTCAALGVGIGASYSDGAWRAMHDHKRLYALFGAGDPPTEGQPS